VILSDFSMPQFNGMSALRIAREIVPEVPFIFVSGTLGEDYAIRALKNGATDYVLKSNLVRLPPTIERAVSEAAARAERRREEQLLALEHTVVRHIASADSALIGLKAIIRAICESEGWDVGRYFRADEKAGVLRFSQAWGPAGSDIERFIEKSRDVREPEDRLLRAMHAIGSQIGQFLARQEQQRHIARLNRIYAVLSGINSTIVRVREREELLREACGIVVRAGGFRLAWLGLVDAEANRVKPVAWEGVGEDYIGMIPLGLDENA